MPDSPPFRVAYEAARQALGGRCPIEAGELGYLADGECDCLNLPTPLHPYPQCGCWPKSAAELAALQLARPAVTGKYIPDPVEAVSTGASRTPDLIATFRTAEDFWRLTYPERVQVVLWLVDGRHQSQVAVAKRLDISESSVWQLVRAGRRGRQAAA